MDIKGTDMETLKDQIRAGLVNHQDVLMLTYPDGDVIEVLYRSDAPYLRAANDTPREVSFRHTIARGFANNDFVAWQRKGSYREIYGK